MWGSDTGGYYGATPTKELFARWLAFSAHTPMMEMLQGPGRTIWDDYDAELVNIARTHCRTHHELIPYVRSHLYQASKTGLAVARPMVFEYPDDPNTVNMWDQYLYGDALLVAPVTTIGATSRTVYLPASGTPWLDCNNKLLSYAPGQTITPAAPLNTIPVLLRAGSIAVQGDILRANQRGADWTGPAWAGPSLRIEAFLPTGTFSSSLPYFRGMTAIPPVGPISLAKSASGISLRIDGLDAGDAKTMAARFYFDAATASAYTQGHLAVQAYRNGAPLSSTVSYDAATRQLDMVLWQVSADADHDGDVDGADYGVFASCFNGSGQPIAPSCGTHDFDLDGDVDGADFGVFAACFNGSGNPPACS
jgi:hypothetical protein